MSKVIQVQERQDALLKASDLPEVKKTAYMLKYRLRRGDLTERTAELYLKKLGYKKIIKYKK